MLAMVKPLLRDSSPQVRREIALMLRDRDRASDASAVPSTRTRSSRRPNGSTRWRSWCRSTTARIGGISRRIGIAARGREDALYARLKNDASARSSAAFRPARLGAPAQEPHCPISSPGSNNAVGVVRAAHERARHPRSDAVAGSGTRAGGVHHEPVERASARGARVRALQPSALQHVDGRADEPGAAADRPEDVRRAWRPGCRGRDG